MWYCNIIVAHQFRSLVDYRLFEGTCMLGSFLIGYPSELNPFSDCLALTVAMDYCYF